MNIEIACPNCGCPMEDINKCYDKETYYVCDYCGTEVIGVFNTIIKNLNVVTHKDTCICYSYLPSDSKLRIAYEDGYNDGKEEGYEDGYDDGREEGYEDGMYDGKKLGFDQGLEEGIRRSKEYILSSYEFELIDKRLYEWRKERNISPHTQITTFNTNMCEEIEEFYTKGLDYDYSIKNEHEYIDAMCDMIIIMINSTLHNNENSSDLYKYISMNGGIKLDISKVFFKDELNNMWDEISNHKGDDNNMPNLFLFMDRIINTMYFSGYNPYSAIDEAIREISARTQDPIQHEKWKEMEKNGISIEEKWEKDKNPEVQKTWYKANYNNALRKNHE